LYGYFQAFIDGSGEASYDDIVKSYLKMKILLKMEAAETDHSVRRDLDNHVSAWKTDKVGPRGLHIRVERIDGIGRIGRGKKGDARYRFVGFKDGSPYADSAKAMGW
jgi:hypothetical protein